MVEKSRLFYKLLKFGDPGLTRLGECSKEPIDSGVDEESHLLMSAGWKGVIERYRV